MKINSILIIFFSFMLCSNRLSVTLEEHPSKVAKAGIGKLPIIFIYVFACSMDNFKHNLMEFVSNDANDVKSDGPKLTSISHKQKVIVNWNLNAKQNESLKS